MRGEGREGELKIGGCGEEGTLEKGKLGGGENGNEHLSSGRRGRELGNDKAAFGLSLLPRPFVLVRKGEKTNKQKRLIGSDKMLRG